MVSRHHLNHTVKPAPSSTFRYSPSNNNNNSMYSVTGVSSSPSMPGSRPISSTGSHFTTTIQMNNVNNNYYNNVDAFSLNSSCVTDNAESECLEHYELNLEKYKGK